MDHGSAAKPALPAWFTPFRLFCYFLVSLLLLMLERGAMGSNGVTGPITATSNGTGIVALFGLNELQSALLPALQTIGLTLGPFLYAELSKRFASLRLIGCGICIWILGVLGTGAAFSYGFVLFCRFLVGAGESVLITLTFPFVDDYSKRKGLWFGFLALSITVGYTVGLIYGGGISLTLGWRWVFWLSAMLGVPLAGFALFMPPVELKKRQILGSTGGARALLFSQFRDMFVEWGVMSRHRVWQLNLWAACPIQGAIAALAFWMVKYGKQTFLLGPNADYIYGGTSLAAAVAGSILGGLSVDHHATNFRLAFCQMFAGSTLGLSFLMGCVWTTSPYANIVLFFLGVLSVYMVISPSYGLTMWTVPPEYRPTSQALHLITIHVFGDIFTPGLTGLAYQRFYPTHGSPLSWRYAFTILLSYMVVSVILYFIGMLVGHLSKDYRTKLPEELLAISNGQGSVSHCNLLPKGKDGLQTAAAV